MTYLSSGTKNAVLSWESFQSRMPRGVLQDVADGPGMVDGRIRLLSHLYLGQPLCGAILEQAKQASLPQLEEHTSQQGSSCHSDDGWNKIHRWGRMFLPPDHLARRVTGKGR